MLAAHTDDLGHGKWRLLTITAFELLVPPAGLNKQQRRQIDRMRRDWDDAVSDVVAPIERSRPEVLLRRGADEATTSASMPWQTKSWSILPPLPASQGDAEDGHHWGRERPGSPKSACLQPTTRRLSGRQSPGVSRSASFSVVQP